MVALPWSAIPTGGRKSVAARACLQADGSRLRRHHAGDGGDHTVAALAAAFADSPRTAGRDRRFGQRAGVGERFGRSGEVGAAGVAGGARRGPNPAARRLHAARRRPHARRVLAAVLRAVRSARVRLRPADAVAVGEAARADAAPPDHDRRARGAVGGADAARERGARLGRVAARACAPRLRAALLPPRAPGGRAARRRPRAVGSGARVPRRAARAGGGGEGRGRQPQLVRRAAHRAIRRLPVALRRGGASAIRARRAVPERPRRAARRRARRSGAPRRASRAARGAHCERPAPVSRPPRPQVCRLEGFDGATLLDCCGERRLRQWLDECQANTDHLVAKAAQYALSWADVQARIEAEAAGLEVSSAPEARLRAADALSQQQASVVDQLRQDARRVSLLVDEQLQTSSDAPPGAAAAAAAAVAAAATAAPTSASELTRRRGSSANLLEQCGELETLHEHHLQALLPQLRSLDAGLKAAQDEAAAAKHALCVRVFDRLRSISTLQSSVAELRNKLHLYTSLLGRVLMYAVDSAQPAPRRHLTILRPAPPRAGTASSSSCRGVSPPPIMRASARCSAAASSPSNTPPGRRAQRRRWRRRARPRSAAATLSRASTARSCRAGCPRSRRCCRRAPPTLRSRPTRRTRSSSLSPPPSPPRSPSPLRRSRSASARRSPPPPPPPAAARVPSRRRWRRRRAAVRCADDGFRRRCQRRRRRRRRRRR